jgi:hypothetical protein
MLRKLILAVLVGTLVAAMPITSAAATPRHHLSVAPRYVPGQIFNYSTLAVARRRWPCCCACWHHWSW